MKLALAFAVLALGAARPAPPGVRETIATLAGALSEGDPVAFLRVIDSSFPDRAGLEASIVALTNRTQVESSIAWIEDSGDGERWEAALDWLLTIRPAAQAGNLERRRERVKCILVRTRRGWRVTGLQPLSLFAPPGK